MSVNIGKITVNSLDILKIQKTVPQKNDLVDGSFIDSLSYNSKLYTYISANSTGSFLLTEYIRQHKIGYMHYTNDEVLEVPGLVFNVDVFYKYKTCYLKANFRNSYISTNWYAIAIMDRDLNIVAGIQGPNSIGDYDYYLYCDLTNLPDDYYFTYTMFDRGTYEIKTPFEISYHTCNITSPEEFFIDSLIIASTHEITHYTNPNARYACKRYKVDTDVLRHQNVLCYYYCPLDVFWSGSTFIQFKDKNNVLLKHYDAIRDELKDTESYIPVPKDTCYIEYQYSLTYSNDYKLKLIYVDTDNAEEDEPDMNFWKNREWFIYGTSISAELGISGRGIWTHFVSKRLGLREHNYALGGKGITTTGYDKSAMTYQYICRLTDGKQDADLITLEVGPNDTDAPLGNLYDSTDNTTFCGALNLCIRYLQLNTDAQICVVSSIPARYDYRDPSNIYYNNSTFGPDNHTQYDMAKAAEQICAINSVHFVPVFLDAGYALARILKDNTLTYDLIHPTTLGAYLIGNFAYCYIKNIPLGTYKIKRYISDWGYAYLESYDDRASWGLKYESMREEGGEYPSRVVFYDVQAFTGHILQLSYKHGSLTNNQDYNPSVRRAKVALIEHFDLIKLQLKMTFRPKFLSLIDLSPYNDSVDYMFNVTFNVLPGSKYLVVWDNDASSSLTVYENGYQC